MSLERSPLEHEGRPFEAPGKHVLRQLLVTFGVAALLATVFTAWTPAGLSPGELVNQLLAAIEGRRESTPAGAVAAASPSARPPMRIGIVAGHSGLHPDTGFVDPGSICADGLTELDVNQSIAELVIEQLEAAGMQADLLQEFDPRLSDYRAVALISIHADSCYPINDLATGYKVTSALDTSVLDRAQRLVTCLVDRYGQATGLRFHPGSITRDMTEYHTFYEIDDLTPAVIIETGFMFLDRDFLVDEPEKAARGIVDGVLCYVNNEPVDVPGEGQP